MLLRVDNDLTKGRERLSRKIEKKAASARRRYAAAAENFDALVDWARTPLPPSVAARLLG